MDDDFKKGLKKQLCEIADSVHSKSKGTAPTFEVEIKGTKQYVHVFLTPVQWPEADPDILNFTVAIGNHPMRMHAYCLPIPNAPMGMGYFRSHSSLSDREAYVHLAIINVVMGHTDSAKAVIEEYMKERTVN